MAERVKVYEEKKGLPVWAWLLPLLLLLAIAAFLLTRHHDAPAPVASNQAAAALPDLGTVHFDTDKATLTPAGQATLQRAAVAMKQNPNIHLRVEGFTDTTGTATHNDNLAGQRAATVASFLEGQGIERSRLTGEGFGAEKQVNTNATEQGRADNRRVELFSQQ